MTCPPWVQTRSGVAFDLLDPRAADVRIDDVIEQLARINRYSGATLGGYGYSVAQHSCLVADILAAWGAPPEIVREGLLHDAAEAYFGDITAPVQRAMRALYEQAIADAIREADVGAESAAIHAINHAVISLRESRNPFASLKSRIEPVVREALGLPPDEHPLVRRADLVALAVERRDLMAPCDRDWALPEFAPPGITTRGVLGPEAAAHTMRQKLADLDDALDAEGGK